MKVKVNLNELVEDKSRKRQTKVDSKIRIHFNGTSIVSAICRRIKRPEVCYVVGCVAWLTNVKILSTLAEHVDGVCLIVTRDKVSRCESNKRKYRRLKCLNDAKSPIQTIGTSGTKWTKALMHHKFLVFLDKDQVPLSVSNGSMNLTESGVRHLENCIFLESSEAGEIFKTEFLRLFGISKPLSLKK